MMNVLNRVWRHTPLGIKVVGGTVIAVATTVMVKRRRKNAKSKFDRGCDYHYLCLPAVVANTLSIVSRERGPKGKFTWIEYNGAAIGDSEFCIEFINKEKGVNLNSHLTPEQDGIGRAFQKMLEENTYWTIALERWIFDEKKTVLSVLKLPWFIAWIARRNILNQPYIQGIGRHTEAEIYSILKKDLMALSKYLGSKKYLFGDVACQYDCAIFGMLVEILWEDYGNLSVKIIKEFPNLCKYCETMKSSFWPDWDNHTLAGQGRLKS